jgi:hypothetical protein
MGQGRRTGVDPVFRMSARTRFVASDFSIRKLRRRAAGVVAGSGPSPSILAIAERVWRLRSAFVRCGDGGRKDWETPASAYLSHPIVAAAGSRNS